MLRTAIKYALAGSALGVVCFVCGGVEEHVQGGGTVSLRKRCARKAREAQPVSNPARTQSILFAAIREVESGGEDTASGDFGESLGPYQISRAYWSDAVEYGGVDWSYDDLVWSRRHCRQIMLWYWTRYGARTDEERARMHVAGPYGPQKDSTLPYWLKVRTLLLKGVSHAEN